MGRGQLRVAVDRREQGVAPIPDQLADVCRRRHLPVHLAAAAAAFSGDFTDQTMAMMFMTAPTSSGRELSETYPLAAT